MTEKAGHYINDLDHLYDQPIVCNEKFDFNCPVCDKKYKTRAGLAKHLEEKDCAPATKMFKGTVTETVGHRFFKETIGEFSPRQRTALANLRRSKAYKPVMRYVLFCMNNKIDPYMFFYWILSNQKPRYYNQALSMGTVDSFVKEYRDHLIKNQELIDSEAFFEQNEDRLLTDDWFLVRSIERGDIGVDFCINNEKINLLERSKSLSDTLRVSLAIVLEKV